MFINEQFLLQNKLAQDLYKHIKNLPIIDFHNHLSPQELYENKPYKDITDVWLKHDHYKWRLMRASGIKEELITGSSSNKEKFKAYAEALEMAYLNPLYHWSHMELKSYFGITDLLTKDNSNVLYDTINKSLQDTNTGPRELLHQQNVEMICTTDDLNDSLEYHKLLQNDLSCKIAVLPTFRPDSLFKFNDESFFQVIHKLQRNTSTTISGITTLASALSKRLDFFQSLGCVAADHGLTDYSYQQVTKEQASSILKKRLLKEELNKKEEQQLTTYLLKFFIKEYTARNMVCQLHIGALRNTNQKMFETLGRDTGYDSLSHNNYVNDLNNLFSEINEHYGLPKTIIYNLHPKDFEALASLSGNFTSDTPGKIQLGAAWWFNDNMRGIIRQLDAYSEYLNINTALGMLTDSRSFLSFVRHDYYRRILCNYIAEKVELGYIPNHLSSLKKLVENLAYGNAKTYFNIKLKFVLI
jgi:glucuronate isomerase